MYVVCIMCMGVYQYMSIFVFVWVHVFACMLQRFWSRSCDPNSVTGDSDLCCYGPNTLAIQRPTLEIIQRFIPIRAVKTRRRFRPVSVISCECLFLYIFLFTVANRCSRNYSYYFMWLSDLFFQYDYLCHFIWCQWVLTLFAQLIWAFIIIISCVEDYHFWS